MTSRDVARVAGVSQATVSRVINQPHLVDPATRDRVQAAFDETGYVPNAIAKAMRTSRAGTIGIISSEIQNPFLPLLLDELTRAARLRHVNVVVWNDDDPAAPMATSGVGSGSVDGLLFTAARANSPGIDNLISRGVPVMLCNRASLSSRADVVMSDHYGSGYAAGSYFVAHGRRKLAAIFGPPDSFASPARQAGFRKAVLDGGLDLPDSRVSEGTTSYETGYAGAMRLLDHRDPPDAVFCSSDIIAYGALDALRERGIGIPDDVWVAGIDGLPMSGWKAFDLTTWRQPVQQIAQQAVDVLLDRIGGRRDSLERIALPTELQPRRSTAFAH